MPEGEPSLEDVYDLVQPEVDEVDRQLGPRKARLLQISDVPQIERDLYLVHDVVAMTCNAGILAWVREHHDETGWILLAQDAFARIGHPQVSTGLEQCLDIYTKKRGSLTHEDDAEQSQYIREHEAAIMKSLYVYLTLNDFTFPHLVG